MSWLLMSLLLIFLGCYVVGVYRLSYIFLLIKRQNLRHRDRRERVDWRREGF